MNRWSTRTTPAVFSLPLSVRLQTLLFALSASAVSGKLADAKCANKSSSDVNSNDFKPQDPKMDNVIRVKQQCTDSSSVGKIDRVRC